MNSPYGANGTVANGNGAHAGVGGDGGVSPPGATAGASHDANVAHPTVARPELSHALWPALASRTAPVTAADEVVDVGALARTVGRGWRALLVGGAIGVLLGLLVLQFVPPWYRGSASVLVRNANDPAGSLLSRFGIAGDVAGAATGGALGGVLKSSLETEVQLLQSRELVGNVVDSLALQARVFEPHGVSASRLFARGPIGTSFRRREVRFTREADGSYRAVSGDSASRLAPGVPGRVADVGTVTLAAGGLPAAFRVQFEDREDAITRADDHLTVEKLGGDVVKLRFTGPDSVTAATVPNAAITEYLTLRRTVDRGINQRRYEFMAAQADTAARQLAAAEDALRRDQEASGVVDPELVGKSELEAVQQVQREFVPLEAERRAAHALVDSVERGAVASRQLAAFPSFLRAPAINAILSQVTQLETERTRLLSTRTERDPDVQALTQSIADLDRGLLPLARTYASALDRQTQTLTSQQGAVESRLTALPGQAESTLRRQREVKALSQVVLGLQAQMIDARLAALSEGGQVRQVDVAIAPKRPLFPRAVWTLPGGAVLGLLAAVAWLLGRGTWSSRVRSATDAERAAGLPAVMMRSGAPVLLPAADAGTIVVVGTDRVSATHAVAEALAAQARARGRSAVVVGRTPTSRDSHAPGEADATALRDEVARADAEHDAVFVAAPPLDDPRTAALLDARRPVTVVAAEGVTGREQLAAVSDTLGRLGVPVLGVVVAPRDRR